MNESSKTSWPKTEYQKWEYFEQSVKMKQESNNTFGIRKVEGAKDLLEKMNTMAKKNVMQGLGTIPSLNIKPGRRVLGNAMKIIRGNKERRTQVCSGLLRPSYNLHALDSPIRRDSNDYAESYYRKSDRKSSVPSQRHRPSGRVRSRDRSRDRRRSRSKSPALGYNKSKYSSRSDSHSSKQSRAPSDNHISSAADPHRSSTPQAQHATHFSNEFFKDRSASTTNKNSTSTIKPVVSSSGSSRTNPQKKITSPVSSGQPVRRSPLKIQEPESRGGSKASSPKPSASTSEAIGVMNSEEGTDTSLQDISTLADDLYVLMVGLNSLTSNDKDLTTDISDKVNGSINKAHNVLQIIAKQASIKEAKQE